MVGLKKIILLFGDAVVFWGALALVLFLRWQTELTPELIERHLLPFLYLYLLSGMLFYSMGLYSAPYLLRKTEWLTSVFVGLTIFLFSATTFFYFYNRVDSGISPQGTLLLFWFIFSGSFILWRIIVETLFLKNLLEKTLIIVENPESRSLAEFLKKANQFSLAISRILPYSQENLEDLNKIIVQEQVQNVVFWGENLRLSNLNLGLPQLLLELNVNFYDLSSLYEQRLQKIYLDSVSNLWILSNVIKKRSPLMNALKDLSERLTAGILLIILSPLLLVLAVLIFITSRAPVYSQRRMGKNNREFTIYKFRTMKADAEKFGPQWAQDRDPRVTRLGQMLRGSHLDELPQLLNIFKGEMAFVGPRPERPEFVAELEKKIPFYNLRHQLKPGVTGWAQINYPYGASLEDAKEKLQYDLYYLKHRSLILDLTIFLKTLRSFFQNPTRE